MSLDCIWIQLDAQSLFSHGDNKLPVGTEACPLGRLQVNANEQVIVTAAERPRQVGVLGSVEELGLVHVAAQGVSHSIVAQGTHGAVEHQRVIVELHQILTFRQLQDVNTPEEQTEEHPDANCVLDSRQADVEVRSDSPVFFGNVQSHHGKRFGALHHPAQPLARSAHLWAEEAVGHAAPDDWRQHLDVQPGRTLGDRVLPLTAEHGC